MRISDLISMGRDWLLSALILGIICGSAFLIGYRLIYKKLCKGTKTLTLPHFLLYAMFFCYIVVVLGVTLLDRHAYQTEIFRPAPFYSYIEAWNQFKDADWRNIILNIFMLVPFGLLLPYIAKIFRKIVPITLAGLVFTLFIEATQLILRRGIFETDDLINNTLGVLIGYGFYRLADEIHKRIKKEPCKISSAMLYQIPLLVTICTFATIFTMHHMQELGNLKCNYIIKANPESVVCNASFDNDDGKAYVYLVPVVSVAETESYAREFFAQFNSCIDEERTDIYDETAFYWNDDSQNTMCLMIDYEGNKISYTNHEASFSDGKVIPDENASEEEVRQSIDALGFYIPQEATFTNQGYGSYRFESQYIIANGYVYHGNVSCRYAEGGIIQQLDYKIIQCTAYKEFPIISEEEAYTRIAEGKFRFEPAFEPENIIVNDIFLSYEVDSKGFYQPIYIFECTIDGQDTRLYTPAIL